MISLNNAMGIIRRKTFNYNLEIEIFKNSTLKKIGCPEGFFLKVWVSNKAPRRPAG